MPDNPTQHADDVADGGTEVADDMCGSTMTFEDWLDLGTKHHYCSAPTCDTHEGLPSTADEDEALWTGAEICVFAVRLYQTPTL